MKKLFLFLGLTVGVILYVGCATSQNNAKPQKQQLNETAITVKEECKNYVSKMEKCLKSRKGKDYVTVWKECEGQVMWDMLKEYQDNGFCFDEEECKQKVLDEINKCIEERNALYRKYMR